VFGRAGYPPGGFVSALLDAMCRADSGNFTRLAIGFPGYASAVWAAQNTDDGLDRLREVAGKVVPR
jgi:hypothetical protein